MTSSLNRAAIHQVAYDVLPPDADDALYRLADRISEAVARAIRIGESDDPDYRPDLARTSSEKEAAKAAFQSVSEGAMAIPRSAIVSVVHLTSDTDPTDA